MQKPILEVTNVSKAYTIAHRESYLTLRDSIASAAKKPLAVLRGHARPQKEKFWALQNVNFTLNQGERLGIIGRNGAGKSTMLKIISQITNPTSGTVTMRGRSASLLEVGTGFHPELTGRENIFLNGAILGMKRREIQKKFDEIVAFAEINQFLDTPVKRYSSGMYMRLAFAVAAHLEPEILIVDEVLAVGDAQFQKKCIGKMQEIGSTGRTVIFVSHNMAAIRSLCNVGLYLKRGTSEGKQPIKDAIQQYTQDMESGSIRKFPIEADDLFLHAFEIQQENIVTNDLDGDLPFEVHMDVEVKKNYQNLRFGFFIRSVLGDTIARYLLADWDERLENIQPGRHTMTATLPSGLLTNGTYIVEPHISQFGIKDYNIAQYVHHQVQIAMPKNFNPGHRNEESFGYILLKPEWKYDYQR